MQLFGIAIVSYFVLTIKPTVHAYANSSTCCQTKTTLNGAPTSCTGTCYANRVWGECLLDRNSSSCKCQKNLVNGVEQCHLTYCDEASIGSNCSTFTCRESSGTNSGTCIADLGNGCYCTKNPCSGQAPNCQGVCGKGFYCGGSTSNAGPCSCMALPPTCYDGIQNGDETGIDCGGLCPFPCSNLVPCTYSSSAPILLYFPYFVNTAQPFAHLTYSSMCGLFDMVPEQAYGNLYLFDGLQINLYGSYNNVTGIQYNIPQPGFGSAVWDLTVSPARLTVYSNGSLIYPFTTRRRLLSTKTIRSPSRTLLQTSTCLTYKQCSEMSDAIKESSSIECTIIGAVAGAAAGGGVPGFLAGIAARAVCNFAENEIKTAVACNNIQCSQPCIDEPCLSGTGQCADYYCTYCECG